MDRFREFVKQHQWTVFCVAVGIVLTVLLLTIGFFKTLLLFVIVGACFALGYMLDKQGTEGVRAFFQRLFHKGEGK